MPIVIPKLAGPELRKWLIEMENRGKLGVAEATSRQTNVHGQIAAQYAARAEASRGRGLALKEGAFNRVSAGIGGMGQSFRQREAERAAKKKDTSWGTLGGLVGGAALGAVTGGAGLLAAPALVGGAGLGVAGGAATGALVGGSIGGGVGAGIDQAIGGNAAGAAGSIQGAMNTALWVTQWDQANPTHENIETNYGAGATVGDPYSHFPMAFRLSAEDYPSARAAPQQAVPMAQPPQAGAVVADYQPGAGVLQPTQAPSPYGIQQPKSFPAWLKEDSGMYRGPKGRINLARAQAMYERYRIRHDQNRRYATAEQGRERRHGVTQGRVERRHTETQAGLDRRHGDMMDYRRSEAADRYAKDVESAADRRERTGLIRERVEVYREAVSRQKIPVPAHIDAKIKVLTGLASSLAVMSDPDVKKTVMDLMADLEAYFEQAKGQDSQSPLDEAAKPKKVEDDRTVQWRLLDEDGNVVREGSAPMSVVREYQSQGEWIEVVE